MAQILYKDVKLFDVLQRFGNLFINKIETLEGVTVEFENHPVVISEGKQQATYTNIFCKITAKDSAEFRCLQTKYSANDTIIFEIIK